GGGAGSGTRGARSPTSSLLGQRVALTRRRSSVSFSSGTSNVKGRTAVPAACPVVVLLMAILRARSWSARVPEGAVVDVGRVAHELRLRRDQRHDRRLLGADGRPGQARGGRVAAGGEAAPRGAHAGREQL